MRIPKHIYIFAEYPYESKYLNVRHTWSYLSHTCLLCGGPRRGHGTWPQPGISPILMWWRRGDVMGTHGNIFPPSSCSQVGTMWGQNDGVRPRIAVTKLIGALPQEEPFVKERRMRIQVTKPEISKKAYEIDRRELYRKKSEALCAVILSPLDKLKC